MTNAATKTEIDYAYATQCLVSLLERTTGLLCTTARGKGWCNSYEQDKIETTLVCAIEFLKALKITPSDSPVASSIGGGGQLRAIRILGDLHRVTSELLVESAKYHARPDLVQPFETKFQVRSVYELAAEFVASAKC